MGKPEIVIIVQARMSSTRLPGKVLKQVLGKPLLGYLLERLHRVSLASRIIVATSTGSDDQVIVDYCEEVGVATFRGSLEDVLSRYKGAAQKSNADIVVRVCADCPVMDPEVVEKAIRYFIDNSPRFDYVSNFMSRYPRGMEVEVMTREALEIAAKEARLPEEREHVTPYIYRHPEHFKLGSITSERDLSSQRWVVDTLEDFELVSRIIQELYPTDPHFATGAVLALLETHPDWIKLNAHIIQRSLPPISAEP